MALAITVFIITYIVIATEKFPRQVVALLGGVILVLLNVFDLRIASSDSDSVPAHAEKCFTCATYTV